jgi:hypothetical protein
MALVTGTPLGTITAQEDIYLEGAPTIYIQQYEASPLFNPDADGFYWNMSGTATYNVYEIGCPVDVSLTEGLTINDVLCDTVGVKDTVQQRNYVEFAFSVRSMLPLPILRVLLNFGTVTETTFTEKMPMGKINNNLKWHLYAPKVYDEDVGDYVWIWLNKAKFVDAWTIPMTFGNPWQANGIKLRAYADTTRPAAQQFGMWGRADASVLA